jgi:hypothetical protein
VLRLYALQHQVQALPKNLALYRLETPSRVGVLDWYITYLVEITS